MDGCRTSVFRCQPQIMAWERTKGRRSTDSGKARDVDADADADTDEGEEEEAEAEEDEDFDRGFDCEVDLIRCGLPSSCWI